MPQQNPNRHTAGHNGNTSVKTARWIIIATAVILTISFLAMAPMIFSEAGKDAVIKIPQNATVANLSDSLTKYFGHTYADKVIRLINVRKPDLSERHGAYLIKKETSPFMAQRILRRGGQHPVRVTINGFRSMPVMIRRIADKLAMNPDQLMKVATDSTILSTYGLSPSQALALFIDDTYEFYWTASPETVIKKIGDNYKKIWNITRREKASHLGLRPDEVMIISSIVDEETLAKSEKGEIGRLYINRLHNGMRLQADPTVKFAVNDFTIRRIRKKHLEHESPYNTYLHAGLPPGPIRTTSRETIDLILDSAPTSAFYMCAKEDFSGLHNFADTYEEHIANSLRYQNALDQKGIR